MTMKTLSLVLTLALVASAVASVLSEWQVDNQHKYLLYISTDPDCMCFQSPLNTMTM